MDKYTEHAIYLLITSVLIVSAYFLADTFEFLIATIFGVITNVLIIVKMLKDWNKDHRSEDE
jgi:uncharacterized membrane protein